MLKFSKYILAILLLLPLGLNAQLPEMFRNSSVSFGTGANYYSGNVGFGAEVAFDKWVVSTVAMRAQIEANFSTGHSSAMHLYYYGHADIMIDLFSALKGRNPSDLWRSYFLMGGGMVHTQGDNDFCAIIGLGAQLKFADDWRFYAEASCMAHPYDFDGNEASSAMMALNFGLVYDIANNPTRSRSREETQRFGNDWFFNVALGCSSVNYGEITSLGQRAKLLTPTFEFGIGKRLTTLWQIRLCASGLYAKTLEDYFSYYNIRGDIMIDPVAYFNSTTSNPKFSARPYLGAGVVTRLDNQSHFLITPVAGMQLAWRADRRNQIYFDARYLVTPPRFVQSSLNQRIGSVGIITLLAGYSYTFSPVSFR